MQAKTSESTAQSEVIDVLVKEARNIPRKLIERMRIRRGQPGFVSIAYGNATKRTRISISDKGVATWNEQLVGITLTESTLIFEIFSQRGEDEHTLVGKRVIPAERLRSLSAQDHTLDINYTGRFFRAQKKIQLDIAVSPHKLQASSDAVDAPLPRVSEDPGGLQEAHAKDEDGSTHQVSHSVEEVINNIDRSPHLASAIVKATQIGSGIASVAATQGETWESLLDHVGFVVDVVDKFAQIHPFASVAWAIISVIPKAIGQQMERDKHVKELVKDLNNAFKTLRDAKDLQARCADSDQAEIISRLMQQTSECACFIESYAKDSNFWKRLVKNVAGDANKLVEQYRTALFGLKREFLERTAVTTKICVLQITDNVERVLSQVSELDATVLLNNLPYGEGARFNPTKRCLPNTRVRFLDEIERWVRDPDSPRMLVLFGQAGTGKSTIASEIAQRFDENGQLMSSFVFDRSTPRDPYLSITTLARDLSDNCAPYKRALVASIRGNASFSLGTRDCSTLFNRLLVNQLGRFDFVGNPLVVIDALDECGDNASQRSSLVAALSSGVPKLPRNFRILVTARAEGDLERAFERAISVRTIRMDDERLGAETDRDILQYIHSHLDKYLSDADCSRIANIAGRLFQWASVACKFISDPPRGKLRSECVDLITSSQAHEPQIQLDQLYHDVLSSLFPHISQDDTIRSRYKAVLGLVLAPFEPLPQNSLIALGRFTPQNFHVTEEIIQSVIDGMGSLLSNVTIAQSSSPIIPLHTSFRDFLTSEGRSGLFFIDLNAAHAVLAESCLKILLDPTAGVRFNICQIPSSYLRNSDISDLSYCIEQHFSVILTYACQFWDDHLEQVSYSESLSLLAERFFREKLLFWLEALSLLGLMNLAMPAVLTLQIWLAHRPSQELQEELGKTQPWTQLVPLPQLSALVKDSISFLRAFGSIIAHYTAHIYVSALSFCPSSSAIYETYQSQFRQRMKIIQGQSYRWPALQMTIATPAKVSSVAFSPRGNLIACGLSNCTIQVYDATTGELFLEPLKGHTSAVYSVTFSPTSTDGVHIASGSEDHTVRIWDARSGSALLGPLKAHTGPITSLAFSPDGAFVASASDDRSIWIWNAMTGQPVRQLLQHEDRVLSVAYSPDGVLIASGSADGTACVWSATSGKVIGEPFSQHTDWVRSVAFSPDSALVVSGSDDHMVLLWKAGTSEATVGSLKGHTRRVYSVAFSPRGRVIASCSEDNTIQVWNAATGKSIIGPLAGHSDQVLAISFSSDGDRIVSGSIDHTIAVWDATAIEAEDSTVEKPVEHLRVRGEAIAFSHDGQTITFRSSNTIQLLDTDTNRSLPRPLVGHSGYVQCAAFSSDSTRLATGSRDHTIRVWDVAKGHMLVGPLGGHADVVTTVAFSPNGALIASGSEEFTISFTIRIWDASTGALVIGPLEGHSRPIYSVVFSPNSQRIASGSFDGTIRVWDVNSLVYRVLP